MRSPESWIATANGAAGSLVTASATRDAFVGHQLADFNVATLDAAASALRGDGYSVVAQQVDVSSRSSVHALAATAAESGAVTQVAHTAGLSPVQAPVDAILRVDLLGAGFVLEEFAAVVASGGAGVVIASMAGHGVRLPVEQERLLATTPVESLLGLPFLGSLDPASAYSIAKRANRLQVQAAAGAWGLRGARINAISPGVIATPMGQEELAGVHGDRMRAMISSAPTGRVGTPQDIAAAAEFLLSPAASFVTGTDLLVDGGVIAMAA